MAEKLSVSYRTSNQVGFILRSAGLVLNKSTLLLETYNASNYTSYVVIGTRVGSTPIVEADVPAGSQAAKYDVTPVEAVGTDGLGAGGFAETLDLPTGGTFSIQWNGTAITDVLGTDVDPAVALVTLAEAKQYIDISGTESDAIVAMIVNRVSGMITAELGRELISKSRTEYYDGDGTCDLILRNRPITGTPAAYIDFLRVFGSDSQIDIASNVIVRKEVGILRAWNLFGSWWEGTANIKVVYTAGYTVGPSGTMPQPIKHATLRTIDHHWRHGFTGRNLDVSSETVERRTTTYKGGELQKDVLDMLVPFKSYNDFPGFSYAD